MAEILLAHGAEINAKDKDGATPLALALKIQKWLKKYDIRQEGDSEITATLWEFKLPLDKKGALRDIEQTIHLLRETSAKNGVGK
jgi:ankyrin repeat protein